MRRTEVEILREALFLLYRDVFDAAFKVVLTQILPYEKRPFVQVIILRSEVEKKMQMDVVLIEEGEEEEGEEREDGRT